MAYLAEKIALSSMLRALQRHMWFTVDHTSGWLSTIIGPPRRRAAPLRSALGCLGGLLELVMLNEHLVACLLPFPDADRVHFWVYERSRRRKRKLSMWLDQSGLGSG